MQIEKGDLFPEFTIDSTIVGFIIENHWGDIEKLCCSIDFNQVPNYTFQEAYDKFVERLYHNWAVIDIKHDIIYALDINKEVWAFKIKHKELMYYSAPMKTGYKVEGGLRWTFKQMVFIPEYADKKFIKENK